MPVAVVEIRIVRVPVLERLKGMGVGMGLSRGRARIVRVLMVLVVPVRVAVNEGLVGVVALIAFSEMQRSSFGSVLVQFGPHLRPALR